MANVKALSTFRAASTGDGDETIVVGFRPKFIELYVADDSDQTRFSRGTVSVDDMLIYNRCTRDDGTPGPSMDLINSVHIETYVDAGSGDGYLGLVTGIDDSGFTINWTKLGAGKSVSVYMTAMG